MPGISANTTWLVNWFFEQELGAVSQVIEDDLGLWVAQLVAKRPAGTVPLDELKDQLEPLVRAHKKAARAAARLEAVRREVEAGATLAQAAQNAGLELHAPEAFARTESVAGLGRGNAVIGAAFRLEEGQLSEVIEVAEGGKRGAYLLRLLEKTPVAEEQFAAQREQVVAQLQAQLRSGGRAELVRAPVRDGRDRGQQTSLFHVLSSYRLERNHAQQHRGQTQIGFIGLGIMGCAHGQKPARGGYPLNVYNRSDRPRVAEVVAAGGRARPLRQGGGDGCGTSSSASVTDTPDMEAVLVGEEGAIHGAKEGAVVIDMSTVSPKVHPRSGRGLAGAGRGHARRAPSAAGMWARSTAPCRSWSAATRPSSTRCLPVFEAMGTNINLIGPNGAGQTTKLCNQIAVSVNNMAMAEALMLAAAADLDVQKVIDAISGGAAGSWQLSNLGPRIAAAILPRALWSICSKRTCGWSCRRPTMSSWPCRP